MPSTVAESMTRERSMPRTVWMPLVVGYLSRPVLAGKVLTFLPFDVTTILWALTLTVLMCASPTLKLIDRLFTPQMPLPALTPARLTLRVTFSRAGQYFSGRQRTSSSLRQCQAPLTSEEDLTSSLRSTVARSFTGSLKYTAIGMPTPTVSPLSGMIDVVSSRAGVSVAKVLV